MNDTQFYILLAGEIIIFLFVLGIAATILVDVNEEESEFTGLKRIIYRIKKGKK